MGRKYLKLSNLIVTGLVLIITGLLTIILNMKLYKMVQWIFPTIILMLSISFIIKSHDKSKRSKKTKTNDLILGIFNLILAVILFSIPQIPFYLIPMLFSVYLILSGIIKFISYYLLKENRVEGRGNELLGSLICFSIGILFIFSPLLYAQAVIAILGFYLFLLGITYIFEYLSDIISIRSKNNFKRRIRITLPKFILALIPYNSLTKINEYFKINGEEHKIVEQKKDVKPDLEIFIHVTKSGFGMIGHADFCFENMVYSYGNYDDTSLRFFQMIGDGVLFNINNKDDYINFCIEHSKKTLFVFGISLNDKQKNTIKNKIKELKSVTYSWKVPKLKDKKMYSNYLYESTKAKFYKFKKGKFKTYFTVNTNCVKLVDEIVKMDVLNITGIISPGTYYDYLYKQFLKKHSNVVSYKVYNKKIKNNVSK